MMMSAEKLDRMAYRLLGEPSLFSRFVVGRPLRPYQLEPARAILRSVLERQGEQFSVMLPRQGGQRELSAHLEAYLLNLHAAGGGTIVKAVAADQARLEASRLRLEWALDNPLNHGRWRRDDGGAVRLGKARCQLLTAEPGPGGPAASILLEFDQAQELEPEDEFVPGAGLTRACYGTPWRQDDLLQRVRAANLERERRDGVRRHFEYPWWVVAEWSHEYGRHVETERARLGDEHPLFRSQYCLETLAGEAALLSSRQRAAMRGDHPRQSRRQGGATYVAGVNLAAEGRPALTVARAAPTTVAGSIVEPRLEVVEQRRPGADEPLLATLRDLWGVARVVVGVGGPTPGPLQRPCGAAGEVVAPLLLTSESRSRGGRACLAAVNGGRFKLYRHEEADDSDASEFWRAAERSRAAPRPGRRLDFWVPPREGRDDFVVSAALCAQAGRDLLVRAGDRHDRR
jgi:hypothetical protein